MTVRITRLAIDTATGCFRVCAVAADGAVPDNRALSRGRPATPVVGQPASSVAMEARARSHQRGRVAQSHCHHVRLVPAAYVKPFVRRQKNDRADAEAIAEAVMRPSMRVVAVKGAETRGRASSIGRDPMAP